MNTRTAEKKITGKVDTAVGREFLDMSLKTPQAVEIEADVLGAMLVDQSSLECAMAELTPPCFHDSRHKHVFEAVALLYDERKPVDTFTTAECMRKLGTLDSVGGSQFLAALSSEVMSFSHTEYHVKILLEKDIARKLRNVAADILCEVSSDTADLEEVIQTSQGRVFDAVHGNIRERVTHISEPLDRSFLTILQNQEGKSVNGIQTGYPGLDAVTQGWHPANLVVLGARPSMGKTALALNFSSHAAIRCGVPTAFFSLEMSSEEIATRLLNICSGIDSDKIKGKVKMTNEDRKRLAETNETIRKAPLFIDETAGLTTTELFSKVRRLVHEKDVRLVFIDYLQLMHAPLTHQQSTREQEVAAISRSLKTLAKEMHITVVALSQLNRNPVGRGGGLGRPTLSDLRDSGSIEQDADLVMFIHRPGILDPNEDSSATQIIIAKHRNGEIRDIDMSFDGKTFRFKEENNSPFD